MERAPARVAWGQRVPSASSHWRAGTSCSGGCWPADGSSPPGNLWKRPSGGRCSWHMTTPLNCSCHACGYFCRILSSGCVGTGTVASCAQASGIWCTVAQARYTPVHSTAWRPARPLPATRLPRGWWRARSFCCWVWWLRLPGGSQTQDPSLQAAVPHPLWGWVLQLPQSGRVILAPMGTPPGSASSRASLICWSSVEHPINHFPGGKGLMELTAPIALALRYQGPSLSKRAVPPPRSLITTGWSTKAGALEPCCDGLLR